MKGMFIPEITVEMFRNACLESIETLMAEGEVMVLKTIYLFSFVQRILSVYGKRLKVVNRNERLQSI